MEGVLVRLVGRQDPTTRLFTFSFRELLMLSFNFRRTPCTWDAGGKAAKMFDMLGGRHPSDKRGIGYEANNNSNSNGMSALMVAPEPRVTVAQIRAVREIHEKMGHLSTTSLIAAVRAGTVDNLPDWLTPEIILKVNKTAQCAYCELARRRKGVVQEGSGSIPAPIGSSFSIDTVFFPVPTLEGFTAAVLFMCLTCGVIIPVLVKGTGEPVYQAMDWVLQQNSALGYKASTIRSDAGTTENSQEMAFTTANYEAIVRSCAAENQRANPVERQVSPVVRQMAILLFTGNVPNSLWGAALNHACLMKGMVPNTRSRTLLEGSELSPVELYYGKRVDLDALLPFGTVVTTPKMGRVGKIDLHNDLGVWLTISPITGLHLVLLQGARIPVERSDVQPLHIREASRPMTASELVERLRRVEAMLTDDEVRELEESEEVRHGVQWVEQKRLKAAASRRKVGDEGDEVGIGMNQLAHLGQREGRAAKMRKVAEVEDKIAREALRAAAVAAKDLAAQRAAVEAAAVEAEYNPWAGQWAEGLLATVTSPRSELSAGSAE